MKSLIAINTYNSAELLKAFIWDYIEFAKSNSSYEFVVSLDGSDKESIEYCKAHNIPLIYSDSNEGVGISKNRVIESLPHYDYYFFIEDDIELLDSRVFDIHIELSKALNIHHFSLFEARRLRDIESHIEYQDYNIIQAMYGGAPFNFFTKEGLERVGGFHTLFAKYKRFGHTEHTYRFVNSGLSKYPFMVIENLLVGYFRWNDPISRIKISVEVSQNRLFIEEERLMEQRLKYFPIETLSPYYKLNIENISKLDRVIVDSRTESNKKRFYRKLFLLNSFRKLKNIARVALQKVR
jgi:hypothetical protein